MKGGRRSLRVERIRNGVRALRVERRAIDVTDRDRRDGRNPRGRVRCVVAARGCDCACRSVRAWSLRGKRVSRRASFRDADPDVRAIQRLGIPWRSDAFHRGGNGREERADGRRGGVALAPAVHAASALAEGPLHAARGRAAAGRRSRRDARWRRQASLHRGLRCPMGREGRERNAETAGDGGAACAHRSGSRRGVARGAGRPSARRPPGRRGRSRGGRPLRGISCRSRCKAIHDSVVWGAGVAAARWSLRARGGLRRGAGMARAAAPGARGGGGATGDPQPIPKGAETAVTNDAGRGTRRDMEGARPGPRTWHGPPDRGPGRARTLYWRREARGTSPRAETLRESARGAGCRAAGGHSARHANCICVMYALRRSRAHPGPFERWRRDRGRVGPTAARGRKGGSWEGRSGDRRMPAARHGPGADSHGSQGARGFTARDEAPVQERGRGGRVARGTRVGI